MRKKNRHRRTTSGVEGGWSVPNKRRGRLYVSTKKASLFFSQMEEAMTGEGLDVYQKKRDKIAPLPFARPHRCRGKKRENPTNPSYFWLSFLFFLLLLPSDLIWFVLLFVCEGRFSIEALRGHAVGHKPRGVVLRWWNRDSIIPQSPQLDVHSLQQPNLINWTTPSLQ